MRHPMPMGIWSRRPCNVSRPTQTWIGTICTIEEREEYEPTSIGACRYLGDTRRFLRQAEGEAV